ETHDRRSAGRTSASSKSRREPVGALGAGAPCIRSDRDDNSKAPGASCRSWLELSPPATTAYSPTRRASNTRRLRSGKSGGERGLAALGDPIGKADIRRLEDWDGD